MSCTKEVYLEKALQFLGTTSGSVNHQALVNAYNAIVPLPRGMKANITDSWCAIYLSAIAELTNSTDIFPCEMSAHRMMEKCKLSTIAQPGKLVFYDWDHNGWSDHVGILVRETVTQYLVLEGNSNHTVRIRYLHKTAQYIRAFGTVNWDPTVIAPVPNINHEPSKTYAQLALEVIQGKWGNGWTRQQRLRDAGYDYNLVQRLVNEMLKK